MSAATRIAVFATVVAFAAHTPAQTPQFRGGVELVQVDVLVLDKSGKPVTDLTAADFTVVAGQKPRRIVSAEYIATRGPAPNPAPAMLVTPAPRASSNAKLAAGRAFLFAVDVDEIRAGEGRLALQNVREYLDRLSRDDRVGLVSLPYGTPRVDVTTDRKAIADALGSIAGSSLRGRDVDMTPGEATSIAARDTRILKDYWERVYGLPPGTLGVRNDCGSPGRIVDEPLKVPEACETMAMRTLEVYRRHSVVMFQSLGALATAMAPIEGTKTLVLVSEGFLNDNGTRDELTAFASACERARVALYALHLDAPLAEASAGAGGSTMTARSLDDHLGFDSMSDVATAARGTALRVIGRATNALTQIDTELSGYYLIAFERDLTDKDGQRQKIDVRVSKPGLDVRARKEFTPLARATTSAAITPAADPKKTMGELLKWPVAIGDIGLDVDTYATPVAGNATDVRILLAADIATQGRTLTAVGYEISDATHKVVADTFDAPPQVRKIDDKRTLYLVALPITAGQYHLKLGVIDDTGARGSVEHTFDVPHWTPNALRISDLMFGDQSAGSFRPIARVATDVSQLVVRLDIDADTPDAFADVTVRVEVQRNGEKDPVQTQNIALANTPDPRRRAVATIIDLSSLGPGNYVVTTIVSSPAAGIVKRTRGFTR